MARTEAQKQQITAIAEELIQLTSGFCDRYLDAECAELAAKLILKMKRKRDVSFLYGRTHIWAAAVIYALCQINYLFDPKVEPHTTRDQITNHFGVSQNYVSQKAKAIRDMFHLEPWDPDFSTQEMLDSDPFKDMVEINGMLVPVDMLSREMQAMVRKYSSRR